MRKPVFPRILLLVLLYCGIFTALVSIQFTKHGGFTQRVGGFVVSGQRRLPAENDPPIAQNEYLLDGEAHIFFGGIDFGMIGGNEGNAFCLTGENGDEEILPERLIISGDSALFIFSNGTELEYSTLYAGGAPEMRISGSFPEGISGAVLPFKLLRKTVFHDKGEGQHFFSADGVNYSFGNSPMDVERRMLLIGTKENTVSYRAIPEKKTDTQKDYILPEAQTAAVYNETLTRWKDQNFSLWNRTISEQNNEDTVIAFAGEALLRGTYKAAVAAVPQSFLRGSSRSYESSAYLGGLDQAYRSLVTREREKIARLSRQINEKSLEFLKEPRVIEYFAVRGQNNFIDAGAELVRTIDPAILALDITPGILEGYVDWKTIRPNTDNPFERLVDQACYVITESLQRSVDIPANNLLSAGRVFSFIDGQGDAEFNLRLGKALLYYADTASDSTLAGIGRSLILSALSLSDASGAVKAGLVQPAGGEITESPVRQDLVSGRLYRILSPGDSYPRAMAIERSMNGIWAWTAAQAVSAVQQNNTLDITVRFPAGETHYMIIRGIRAFARIQLYEMDFRSDPQFERYDSSGWVYYPQEQVLVLKMKHRGPEEHVKIIYREETRPAAASPASAPPAAVQPSADNAAPSSAQADAPAD